jgi:hypothetical protein
MNRTVRLAALAAAIALVSTTTLAGCFGNPVEQIIEGATGGDVDLGGNSLPDGYPSNEVPIADGEIVFGIKLGDADNQIFNVTVKTGGDPTDEVRDRLIGAGFSEQTAAQASTNEGSSYVFTSDAWGVLVVIGQIDGEWNANYTVTKSG